MEIISFIGSFIIGSIIIQVVLQYLEYKKAERKKKILKFNNIIKMFLFILINIGMWVLAVAILNLNIMISAVLIGIISSIIYDLFGRLYNKY